MEILFAILWYSWIVLGLCAVVLSLDVFITKRVEGEVTPQLAMFHKVVWRIFLLGGIIVGGLFWVAVSVLENL